MFTPKARRLAKALAAVFPGSLFVSRAGKSVDWLVSFARYQGLEVLVIVSPLEGNRFEWRGIAVSEGGWLESFSAEVSVVKEASWKKLVVGEVSMDVRGKKAADLLGRLLDPELVCSEAEFAWTEKGKTVSFRRGEAELGPSFCVERVSFEG